MNLIAWLCEIIRRDVVPAACSTGASYVSAVGFSENESGYIAAALAACFLVVILARRWDGNPKSEPEITTQSTEEQTHSHTDSSWEVEINLSLQISIKGRMQ